MGSANGHGIKAETCLIIIEKKRPYTLWLLNGVSEKEVELGWVMAGGLGNMNICIEQHVK